MREDNYSRRMNDAMNDSWGSVVELSEYELLKRKLSKLSKEELMEIQEELNKLLRSEKIEML